MMSARALLALLSWAAFLVPARAIYEEQAGNFDWHRANVGKVTHALTFGTKTFIATSEHIVAAVDSKRGKILWRQILEEDSSIIDIKHQGKYFVSLSSPNVVRVWHSRDGSLVWASNSTQIDKETSHLSTKLKLARRKEIAIAPPFPQSSISAIKGVGVVLVDGTRISLRQFADGEIIWDVVLQAPSGTNVKIFHSKSTSNGILLLGEADGVTSTWLLNASSGEQKGFSKHPEITCPKTSDMFGTVEDGYVVLSSSSLFYLGEAPSEASLSSFSSPFTSVQTSDNSNVVLVHTSSETLLFSLKPSLTYVSKMAWPKAIIGSAPVFGFVGGSNPAVKQQYVMSFVDPKAHGTLSSTVYDLTEDKGLKPVAVLADSSSTLYQNQGEITLTTAHFMKKSAVHRGLVSSSSWSLSATQNGKVLWTREEALAKVIGAEILPLPLSPDLVGGSEEDDIHFPGFIERIGIQIKALTSLSETLFAGGEKSEDLLHSDHFGLQQLVVVLTSPGKAYGLSTTEGSLIWQTTLECPYSAGCSWKGMIAVNPSLVVMYGNGKDVNDGGVLVAVMTRSGEIQATATKSARIRSLSKLPLHSATKAAWRLSSSTPPVSFLSRSRLLLVSSMDGTASTIPATKDAASALIENKGSIFLNAVNAQDGVVQGFALSTPVDVDGAPGFKTEEIWTMILPKISDVTSASIDDPIHSPTTGLGDGRAPRRKYLNKALMAVATVNTGGGFKDPGVTLYLLDTVTGKVLHRVEQKNGQGPVHLAMTENVVIMHYFNRKTNIYEISVIELFEHPKRTAKADAVAAAMRDDDGIPVFTSRLSPTPETLQKTFQFQHSVRTLSVTGTQRGITSKLLLVGTHSHQLAGIHRHLLDARRPFKKPLTKDQMADGLVLYHPVILMEPKTFPSYNQTVANIRSVVCAPTFLESTSLTLAFGTDLFFTRVTPSGTFDLLSSDFNKPFLAMTVTLVVVLLGVTYGLSRQKRLNQLWS
mmetsp:Transcript_23336/g.34932  ORF Transcript_23336/g.34932 Transcript_23336/m.34932 type:complete len:985 (+) Transcript_23336:3-2957(+)